MDFGNEYKDFKSMTLEGQYDRYNKQKPYILTIANLNSGCGRSEFW